MSNILGELSEIPTIEGQLSEIIDYQTYSGDYDITPLFGADTELQTRDRVLKENVMIKRIPYFETPTQNGGTTVYIGMEVE